MEHSTKREGQSGMLFGEFLQPNPVDESEGQLKARTDAQHEKNLDKARRKLKQRISLGLMTEMLLIDSLVYHAPKRVRRQVVADAENYWNQYKQSLSIARITGGVPRVPLFNLFS